MSYSYNTPLGSNIPSTGQNQVTKTTTTTKTVNGVTTTTKTTTTTNGDITSNTQTTRHPIFNDSFPSSTNQPFGTSNFPSAGFPQGTRNFGFPDINTELNRLGFGGIGAPSHQGSFQQPTQQTYPSSKPAASPRGGTNINLNTFPDTNYGGYKPASSPRNNQGTPNMNLNAYPINNIGGYKPASSPRSNAGTLPTHNYHVSPSFQTASPDNRGGYKPAASPRGGATINLNTFPDANVGTYKPPASPRNNAGTIPTTNYNGSPYQNTSPDNRAKYNAGGYISPNSFNGGYTPSQGQYGTQNTQQYTPPTTNYSSPYQNTSPDNTTKYNTGGYVSPQASFNTDGTSHNVTSDLGRIDLTQSTTYQRVKKDESSPPKPNTVPEYKPEPQGEDHDELMRVSLIQSKLTKNPYFYHNETAIKIDDQPTKPKYEEEKEEDDEKLRISKVFAFFSQPGSELTSFITLLGQLKISGQKHTDNDFPPNLDSLIGKNYMRRGEWGSYIWLRPDDFYGQGKYNVFVDQIEPSDIKQGQLGDCYFLSTIASLAEWPDRIRKLFVTKQANTCGCYCVKICDMGEWKEVVVDDFFPCDKYTKKPVFTRGNDAELWVLILEKVWAKLYGSYDAIEAGLARECLHDLTGAPTKFYLTDRQDEWEMIWRKLVKAEKKHFAMTCGAGDFFTQSTANMVTSKGLVSNHAYSLLSVHEVDTHRGKARLVKLRNPWAKTEWNGAWGDSSPNWTPELKQKLNVQKKDDGIFFMAFEDFMKYFSDIQVCYVYDNYKYSAKRVTAKSRNATYFKIKIDTPGKYYLTVNQESKRKAQNANFKYTTVFIVVGKVVGNQQYEYVTGNNRADREVWAKGFFNPGEYIVYAKLPWSNAKNNDFVLSSYGPAEAQIEVVPKQSLGNFLESTFMSVARTSKKAMNYAREGEPNCCSVVDLSKDGFVYCYYRNNSMRTLDTEIYFKEFNGVKLRKPFRGRTYRIQVPPQQEKIVLLKVLPNQDVKQVLAEKVRFVKDEPGKTNTYGTTQNYGNPSTGYGTDYGKPSYY